ncbi:chromosome partitioning protein ParA [Burkholderia territorii]|uniref:AAA family ATPase n=1 Tax=Burkholderia TaxID=32008 RepID=UPI00075F416D|nr:MULTISPECIES: AAA family ATPase [Burkholderia]KUY95498.1 chromosome partitioning protein ParA [Burkholderia territorii]KUZ05656.1 chromosome partitioning protein ParA [Burkholderia territorii]
MIVAVGNPKGGVGKSTVAVQLALGVMLAGQRAWLVDGDPQGSSAGAALVRSDAGLLGLASLYCDDGQELHRAILANSQKYDHVVIDIGARDSSAFRAALAVADVVLIPVMPRSFDVWALDDMAKLLGEARKVNRVRALAFLNAADTQGADNREAEAAIASYDAFDLLPCRLYRRKAYANASAAGLHVEEMGRRDTTACAEIERLQDAVFGVLDKSAAGA